MSLLTEQEIAGCWMANADPSIYENYTLKEHILRSSRAIESAVIEKIRAQGPAWYHKHWGEEDDIFYTPYHNVPDGSVPLYRIPEGDLEMKPELNPGEIYVGRINDHHVILLPGDNDDAPWQEQMDWAKSIGVDLPNRIEQAILWANHRDQFQKDWYWSNETHHKNDAYAWCQIFGYGDQYTILKGGYVRARAVRRLPIE